MQNVYQSDIIKVRAVEDSIRSTKKYIKGYFAKPHHEQIQGGDFPSRCLVEHYEIYPDMKINWDMSIIDAVLWLGGATPSIKVTFKYNYNTNKAWMTIYGGGETVHELNVKIPNFYDALKALTNGNGKTAQV